MQSENACYQDSKGLDWALLVLRLAAGLIFVLHGYGKLFGNTPGMEAFSGMVAGLGFPASGLFAYLAALSEFFGGLALILGVFTKYASAALAIVMLVALGMVKKFKLPMADLDLSLLATVVALYLAGPGAYTIQCYMKKGQEKGGCGGSCGCKE